MEKIIFGKTNLSVGRTGFGCIPIQRISYDESTALLRWAFDGGVTVYDTANGYTTSEERIGIALKAVRKDVVLCTKSGAGTPAELMTHLDNSLKMMQTDYIDVFQFHNPARVPMPSGDDGLYDALAAAQKAGKVRFIGISAHKQEVAVTAVSSGFYDVLQFPFSYLSTKEELAIADLCRTHNVGVLGMKALCGGILTNAKAAFAFLRPYANIVPIWGIQETAQLDEFLAYEKNAPTLDSELKAVIEADREALAGAFCRACGYCLPCPAEIPIPMAARMQFLLGRMRRDVLLAENWQQNMRKIDDCTDCGHCKAHCPYELDVSALLREHQKAYFACL
ncbi:MAG: aldo/keto reductase [Defluviitaleaceae bacterium]|nr:aldo/keto reductase [Defluviitaleaceae bacterium]MCL2275687.1 aldo/keto reductase [Defluviitaleaceae bacterium]